MTRGIAILLVASVCTGVVAAQSAVDPSESPRWQVAARGRGLPAVSGDRVFALTSDHQVIALALDDGHELWRRSTGERGATTDGMRVVGGRRRRDRRRLGRLRIRHRDRRLALDLPPHGRLRARILAGHRRRLPRVHGVAIGPALRDRCRHRPSSVEHRGRAGRRRRPTVHSVRAGRRGGLVVAGYTVFAAPDTGGVVAVDAETGVERWRFRFPVPDADSRDVHLAGGPVVTADLAIASSGDGRVWAIDLVTGTLKWSLPPLDGPTDGIITTTDRDMRGVSMAGGHLIVGSLTGYLTAYELSSQRQVWQLRQGWLGSLSWRDFTSADGTVYVPFLSGFLHAIDAATGEVLWKTRDYRRGFSWPVAVAGDRVIVAASSGVWALDAARRLAPGGNRR